MKAKILFVVLMGAVIASAAHADQATITPSISLRVVNPGDPGDVRILYKFTLPDAVVGSDIVRAFLLVPTTDDSVVPIAATLLDANWSSADSWQTIAGRLAASELDYRSGMTFVGANEAGGFEVPMTLIAMRWAAGGENFGICLSRYRTQSDNLETVLGSSMSAPELTDIYIDE